MAIHNFTGLLMKIVFPQSARRRVGRVASPDSSLITKSNITV